MLSFKKVMARKKSRRLQRVSEVIRSVRNIIDRFSSQMSAKEISELNNLVVSERILDMTAKQMDIPVKKFEKEYGRGCFESGHALCDDRQPGPPANGSVSSVPALSTGCLLAMPAGISNLPLAWQVVTAVAGLVCLFIIMRNEQNAGSDYSVRRTDDDSAPGP